MSRSNNKRIKIPPKIKPHEEYDLKHSFGQLNQYRGSDTYQTDSQQKQIEQSAPSNSNLPNVAMCDAELTGTIGGYYRLEDKINALSDKNDNAHNSLRSELDKRIYNVSDDLKKHIQDDQISKRWRIGIIVTIILAIVGYIISSYQKLNSIHEDVVKIQTIIDENIKPSLEQNAKAINQNAKDIKSNTEKIYQQQNQPQKKQK